MVIREYFFTFYSELSCRGHGKLELGLFKVMFMLINYLDCYRRWYFL